VRGNLNDYPNEDISLYLGSNFHFVIYPVNQNKEFNFISIIKKQLSNQQLSDENLYTEENFLNSITQELYKKTSIELEGKLKNIKSFPIYISKKMEISNNKNIFFIGDALFALPPSFAQGASQSIESSKELFDQIENNKDDYYEKRIKKLNSVNWRSKLNYFSFHLSNPIVASFRNSILKVLVKNNKFLDSYLGKIYRD
jgi:salicylate hydroxylase